MTESATTAPRPLRSVRRALGQVRRSAAVTNATKLIAVQARRAEQRMRSRFVRGVWLDTAHYLASRPGRALALYRRTVFPAGETLVPAPTFAEPPLVRHPSHPITVAYPAAVVSVLVRPWVVGHGGAVLGADRRLLWDLSYEWPGRPDRHTAYTLPPQHPQELAGSTATLAAMSADSNYFHFLLNSVARLAYLHHAPKLGRADRYLVSGAVTDFVADALLLFGISRDQIVGTDEYPAIRPERLLAPPLVQHPFVVPEHVCTFLRSAVRAALPVPSKKRRRIFIDRSDAAKRRVANLAELRPLLDRYDIEVVRLAGTSVAEQATLFSAAELVIANHGAALANLVFCEPGTRVLQLLAPAMMEREYRTLSEHNRLRHDYLVADFATPDDADRPLKDRDLVLAPALLARVLEADAQLNHSHSP